MKKNRKKKEKKIRKIKWDDTYGEPMRFKALGDIGKW
jgi:hypothetical protein